MLSDLTETSDGRVFAVFLCLFVAVFLMVMMFRHKKGR